jgi:hypothetical protein
MDKKTLSLVFLSQYLTIVVSFVLTIHMHLTYLVTMKDLQQKHFGKVEDSHQHCPNGIILTQKQTKKPKKCSKQIILQNLEYLWSHEVWITQCGFLFCVVS